MLVPRLYQEEALQLLDHDPRLILADDCGLGKTLVGVEYARRAKLAPVLVICNQSAIPQWVETVEGQGAGEQILVPGPVSYSDYYGIDWVFITWSNLVHKASGSLFKHVWPLVIADEAHRAKNRKTRRATCLHNLYATRRLALTATPYEKRDEVWSLLHWMDPEEFRGYWAFVEKYFKSTKGFWGGVDLELIDEEGLNEAEHRWILRRAIEDVLPDLPPLIEIVVPLEMTPLQKDAYRIIKKAEDNIVVVGDLQMTILNALSMMMKLQQVSSYPTQLGIPAPSCKVDWLEDFLEDHPDLRIVFFTRFIALARYIAQKLGCECVAEQKGTAEPFRKGQDQYLVMTIDSGSESLDLGIADVAIFVEMHWSSIAMYQAKRRIYRSNITTPKRVYYLSASPVDRHIYDCAKVKMDERDMVLRFLKSNHKQM